MMPKTEIVLLLFASTLLIVSMVEGQPPGYEPGHNPDHPSHPKVKAQPPAGYNPPQHQSHPKPRFNTRETRDTAGRSPISRVDLGTAKEFAILAKTGVTTTGTTSVTGDIGVSPIGAASMTGFGLVLSGSSSTSSLVVGNIFASDYVAPTPVKMTTAISDMQTAYTDAAGRTNPVLNLASGSLGGLTLGPGLYKWTNSVGIVAGDGTLTFDGSADAVWILQISQGVSVGSGASITLAGGAQAKNIFWQIAGATTFGTSSHVEGVFLCMTNIVFQTGSSLNGAALAQTAVTLDAATIVRQS